MSYDFTRDAVIIEGTPTLSKINETIAKPTETRPDKKYYIILSITTTMALIGLVCWGLTFWYGIGMWGENIPVAWAFDITNFVFWIGIGHAAH